MDHSFDRAVSIYKRTKYPPQEVLSAPNPGWISRHRAYYDIFTDEIRIYGGEIWQSDDTMKTNDRVYALPMKTLEWRDLGPLPVAGDA